LAEQAAWEEEEEEEKDGVWATAMGPMTSM
jgi:hypothetical protein